MVRVVDGLALFGYVLSILGMTKGEFCMACHLIYLVTHVGNLNWFKFKRWKANFKLSLLFKECE